MPKFFEKIGSPTFTQFDSRLGGVPSLLAQNYNPAPYDARKAERAAAAPVAAAQPPAYPKWEDQKSLRDKWNYILKYGLQGPDAPEAPVPEGDFGQQMRTSLISAAPRLAKLLGASQEDVDKAVEYKKAWEKAGQETGRKIMREHPGMGKIMSGTEGAVNAMALGIPAAIAARQKDKEPYEIMKELRQRYPGANVVGNIAGSLASASYIPSISGVAGGTGLLAKGVLPALARGAVNTAMVNVPTTIAGAVETGNVGEALKSGGVRQLIGTVGGAIGEGLGELAGKGWRSMRNWLNTKVNAAAGVRSREVLNAAREGVLGKLGVTPDRVEKINEKVADLVSKAGGPGKGMIKDLLEDQGQIWDKIDDAWAASGKTVDDLLPDVLNHPDVMEALTSNAADPATHIPYAQYAKDVLDDVVSRVKSADNPATMRKILWDGMKLGLKKQNEIGHLGTIEADINGALRDAFDNAAEIPQWLKAEYPALLVLKKSLAWNEARTLGTGANSATAARMMLNKFMSGAKQYGPGAALGGVAGGIMGASQTGFDPKDRSTWLPALGVAGASILGGAALNKLLAKGQTQGAGYLAGLARSVLPKALPEAVTRAAPVVGSVLGSRVLPAAFSAIQRQASEQAAPVAPAIEGGKEPAETSIERTEAATTPEAKETAKEQVNTAWADRIREKLNGLYDFYIAPQYSGLMSREQFMAQMEQVTQGFDPRYTAGVVFPDRQERERYLRSYESALKLQSINIDEALNPGQWQLGAALLGNKKGDETKIAYDQLRDFAAGLMAEPGKMPEKRVLDQVTAELNAIIGMKIPLARKKQLIRDHLANWGLDLDKLAEYGLGGNTGWA